MPKEESLCAKAAKCGACSFIGMSYQAQLKAKDAEVAKLFADIAPKQVLRPIMGMDDPTHYRNKVISPFVPGKRSKADRQTATAAVAAAKAKGKSAAKAKKPPVPVLTGMYAPGTHDVVNTDGCLVENADANAVVVAVRQIMQKYGMEPYNEDTGKGFVRHVVVRVGHGSGEMLVTVVTNGDEFASAKAFCRELIKRCPRITTIVQNINTRNTNVILGEKERTLYGPGFILDSLCGLSFRISSQSFYQVNAVQTEVLYREAIRAAGLTGREIVLDAYCGTGTIGLVAAKGLDGMPGAKCVVGVDSVASAIRDAQQNTRHNNVENARFFAQDATKFMLGDEGRDALSRRHGEKWRDPLVVMMDPPRAGSTPEFLRAVAHLGADRVVYVSCNPKTQVRDVKALQDAGYQLEYVQPVDMFPHTPHVETVVLMSRGKG